EECTHEVPAEPTAGSRDDDREALALRPWSGRPRQILRHRGDVNDAVDDLAHPHPASVRLEAPSARRRHVEEVFQHRLYFVEPDHGAKRRDPREPAVHLEEAGTRFRHSTLKIDGAPQPPRQKVIDGRTERGPERLVVGRNHFDRDPLLEPVSRCHPAEEPTVFRENELERDLASLQQLSAYNGVTDGGGRGILRGW